MPPSRVDPIDAIVGANLKRHRRRLGLGMGAVGETIGVSYQQVQKYETGVNRLSAGALYRLASHFGVSIGDFFAGIEGDSPPPFDHSVAHQIERIDAFDPRIGKALRDLTTALAKP